MSEVGIEYAFRVLLKTNRGGYDGRVDADVFRHGDLKDIGKLLQIAADKIEERVGRMEFETWERENGQPAARLGAEAKMLRTLGQEVEVMAQREPKDYHWRVVGTLVGIVGGLLDHIEGEKNK